MSFQFEQKLGLFDENFLDQSFLVNSNNKILSPSISERKCNERPNRSPVKITVNLILINWEQVCNFYVHLFNIGIFYLLIDFF